MGTHIRSVPARIRIVYLGELVVLRNTWSGGIGVGVVGSDMPTCGTVTVAVEGTAYGRIEGKAVGVLDCSVQSMVCSRKAGMDSCRLHLIAKKSVSFAEGEIDEGINLLALQYRYIQSGNELFDGHAPFIWLLDLTT